LNTGVRKQGDQIRLFFANWAIVYRRKFFLKIAKIDQFLATFSKVKVVLILILTKNELGFTFGDFFTNTSGHPVRKLPLPPS
jgi:hypothetical protein